MKDVEWWCSTQPMQQGAAPLTRVAELAIDPAHLQEFKLALHEGIETSVHTEPGVLALYAVSLKENPSLVLVFEMYKDEAAYDSHRETAHFKKFSEITGKMVRSRKFLDVDPIMLGAKAHWANAGD